MSTHAWKYIHVNYSGIKKLCENIKLATDFPPFHGAGQIFTDFIIVVLEINTIMEICIYFLINIRVYPMRYYYT